VQRLCVVVEHFSIWWLRNLWTDSVRVVSVGDQVAYGSSTPFACSLSVIEVWRLDGVQKGLWLHFCRFQEKLFQGLYPSVSLLALQWQCKSPWVMYGLNCFHWLSVKVSIKDAWWQVLLHSCMYFCLSTIDSLDYLDTGSGIRILQTEVGTT